MNDHEEYELHRGYEFEEGMFSRMRSWVDVAPWIRLARVSRLIASPVHVGLITGGWIVTSVLAWFAFRPPTVAMPIGRFVESTERLNEWFAAATEISGFVFFICMWLLWTPLIQVLCRAGASLVAGRGLPSLGASVAIVKRRIWMSYLVPIVPAACVFVLAVLVFLIRLPSMLVDWTWLSMASGWVIGIGAIPIGILAFGALFAIPFATSAMVCEPDPDVFDSLSRGYEYVYRRPIQLVWYGLISVLLIYLASHFFHGVAVASMSAVDAVSGWFNQDRHVRQSGSAMIAVIVLAWQTSLTCGLFGGCYLLLRHDAGGQEVEDFWVPPPRPTTPLPKLPEDAYKSD